MARPNQNSAWRWIHGPESKLNSIQARLVGLTALIFVTTWICAAQIANIQGFRNTQAILDREVGATANWLLHLPVQSLAGRKDHTKDRDIQVWMGDRTIYSTSINGVHQKPNESRSYTKEVNGEHWVYSEVCENEKCLVYGVAHQRRHQNLYCLVASIFGPIFVVLAAGFCAAVLSIRIALSPLKRLAINVSELDLESPTPLEADYQQREFSSLIAAINGLSAQVSSLLQRERMFLGSCAHEIRTPITGLLTQLQLIEDKSGLENVNRCAQRTARVAHQFLNFAASKSLFSAGGSPEIFDICYAAKAVVESVENTDQPMRIELTGLSSLSVKAHPFAIDTIVENLIQNSIKHGSTKSAPLTIRITIGSFGKQVHLTVEDNGPGLREQDYAAALTQFGRINHRKGVEGTGLGLSIVNELIYQYNGSTQLGLSDLGGLRVSLQLPIAYAEYQQIQGICLVEEIQPLANRKTQLTTRLA